MPSIFDDDGVRFLYPDNWTLERTDHDAGWAITVQGPDTAFLTVAYRDDEPDPAAVADTAIAALREDYSDLEADPVVETIAAMPAVGFDVRFLSLDLPVSVRVRGIACVGGSLLVMTQLADIDADKDGPVLAAMIASLNVDE